MFLLDAINGVGDEWMFSECVADRRAQFEKLEYTELDYQEELEHIEQVCEDSCSNLDSYLPSFLVRQWAGTGVTWALFVLSGVCTIG